jgi:quercetin dioxygenase-like cupin family protein
MQQGDLCCMKLDRNNQFDNTELEKSKAHIIVEILEYGPITVLPKTINKNTTGNITVSAVDEGEELAEKTLAFDSFIQIIDGAADVVIKGEKFKLTLGEGIIIPAHASHCIEATEQFKMISTIIKSGYED